VTGVIAVDSISKVVSVIAEIDQYFLSCVSPGLKAVTVIDHCEYSLTLSSVDSMLTGDRFKAVLLFDDVVQPSLLRDQVRLRLHLSEPTDAIQVPLGGFYKDTGGNFIYVVRNDTIVKRNIMLGRKNSEYFEVLAGLEPGEEVITSTYDWLGHDKDTLSLREIRKLNE
jgi:HlyD family secretion protein